jgi:hypothetical protein
VLLYCFHKDKDVVQVDTDHSFRDEVLEDVVHHGLKIGQTIGETKEHDQRFKEFLVGAECSFPLVTFFDLDIVVPPVDIQFCKVTYALEMTGKVKNQWKWINIFNCLCIECLVVLNRSEGSILLLNKEY